MESSHRNMAEILSWTEQLEPLVAIFGQERKRHRTLPSS